MEEMKPKKGRKPFPPETHKRAKELKAEGHSVDAIADMLHVSSATVYQFLKYPVPRGKSA